MIIIMIVYWVLSCLQITDVIFEEKIINNRLKCFIQLGLMPLQLELLRFLMNARYSDIHTDNIITIYYNYIPIKPSPTHNISYVSQSRYIPRYFLWLLCANKVLFVRHLFSGRLKLTRDLRMKDHWSSCWSGKWCDQNGDRVSKNDKKCYICIIWLKGF